MHGYLFLAGSLIWPCFGQVAVGPQVRVDRGGASAASETAIGAAEGFPEDWVACWNDWRESGAMEAPRLGTALSTDGGRTWLDFIVRPPEGKRAPAEGDPMTAFDAGSGTLWVGGIAFSGNGGIFVAKKLPGRSAFEPTVMATEGSPNDKALMRAGPRPGALDQTNLYIVYNIGLLRSFDLGETWSRPILLPTGVARMAVVGPNGELYIVWWDLGTGVKLSRSFDGGTTFDAPRTIATRMDVWAGQSGDRFPGRFRVPPFNYLGIHPRSGDLYCVYFDTTNIADNGRNVDLYFLRSTDRGETWSTPRIINGDPDPPGDQFFPWIETDRDGNLHLVFLDSRRIVQNDDEEDGFFDAYYAFSEDFGATWTEHRLTPEPFNSRDDGLDRPEQFIGDYLGLAVSGDQVRPAYVSTQNGDADVFTHVIEVAPGLASACCLPDGSCAEFLPSVCYENGGRPAKGLGCIDAECPPPGACCLDDANCIQVSQPSCTSKGGTFQGAGISCVSACPCGKIKRFSAACDQHRVKIKLVFNDYSQNGRPVIVSVDGNDHFSQVSGRKAVIRDCCHQGTVFVELKTPKGCNRELFIECGA